MKKSDHQIITHPIHSVCVDYWLAYLNIIISNPKYLKTTGSNPEFECPFDGIDFLCGIKLNDRRKGT